MRLINYPQTDAFFILYSIDNQKSLQNALNMVCFKFFYINIFFTKWYPEVKINNYDNNPVVFVCNKSDLRDEASTTDEGDLSIIPMLSMKEVNVLVSF